MKFHFRVKNDSPSPAPTPFVDEMYASAYYLARKKVKGEEVFATVFSTEISFVTVPCYQRHNAFISVLFYLSRYIKSGDTGHLVPRG